MRSFGSSSFWCRTGTTSLLLAALLVASPALAVDDTKSSRDESASSTDETRAGDAARGGMPAGVFGGLLFGPRLALNSATVTLLGASLKVGARLPVELPEVTLAAHLTLDFGWGRDSLFDFVILMRLLDVVPTLRVSYAALPTLQVHFDLGLGWTRFWIVADQPFVGYESAGISAMTVRFGLHADIALPAGILLLLQPFSLSVYAASGGTTTDLAVQAGVGVRY